MSADWNIRCSRLFKRKMFSMWSSRRMKFKTFVETMIVINKVGKVSNRTFKDYRSEGGDPEIKR